MTSTAQDHRVAVLDDYQHVAADMAGWGALSTCAIEFFHDRIDDEDKLIDRLVPFDIIVAMRERTRFPAAVLQRLPNLRLLVTTGPFNAIIDTAAARNLRVVVAGTRYSAPDTAELTWGLILALARQIPIEDRAIRAGEWQTTIGTVMSGSRLGILGLGNVGARVARIGQAFDMDVAAWSQNLTPERARDAGVAYVDKDELFGSADVLSIHLLLSDRTRGLVGARELAQMKPTAILVNTSRGPIVNETALVEALQNRTIGGAALDVYSHEPLPVDHPLRRLDKTVLTPHIGYVTRDCYRIFFEDVVEDIATFLAGSPTRVIN